MRCSTYRQRGCGLALPAALALLIVLIAAQPIRAQSQGLVLTGSITGSPGSTVTVPLTVVLNSGVNVDTFGITVAITPVGGAPALSAGQLSFTPANGISSPGLSAASAGSITLAWLGNLASSNKHSVSGTATVGTITATIPPAALNGQSYAVQITKLEGDATGANGVTAPVPLAAVSSMIGPVSTSLPLPPVIQPHGVLNAASLSASAVVSPGSIASLFGLNLAQTTAVYDSSSPPPTSLAGTQLFFNGVAAPLFAVSPGQINFQVPAEITGSSVQAMAVSAGGRSLTATVQIAPETPGIFTQNFAGTGQAAVLNQDYSINSPQNPAAAGSVVMIYATGLGPTTPPFASGQQGGTSTPNVTVTTPVVTINGASAQVLYSGLAPGFAGAYQVNAVVPAGTPSGSALPLQLQIGGQTSNTATIAVH